MDELQKLYDVLFRKGKYTKSFEEFQVKWGQDQSYKDKVYDVVSRDGLYTKDKNSFFQKYSVAESTPRIEQPITQPEQEPINVKKNDLPIGGEDLQDGFDFFQPVSKAPSVLTPQAQQEYIAKQEQKPVKIPVKPPTPDAIPKGFQTYQAPSEEETQGYSKNFLDNLSLGVNNLARVVATIPKATYTVFSMPQNALAWATGLDISTNANKFGKTLGIENPILKQLDEEDKVLNERIQKFNKTNYEDSSVYENIKLGNYGDAFELMGSGIAQSAPVSLAMMYGGATLTAPQLVAAGTIAFEEGSRDQLEEDSPNMPEIEKTIKALAMSSAETVFSSIGTGTIGQVYRDIIKKEGVEAGKVLFKDGLVEMYKSALKKYGAPIGLLGEGIEEAATQITQNLISGRPAFQGAADAFIIGGGSGVAFSAPINIIQAKEQINNIVETNKAKSDINTILKDNPSELHQIFNVSQAEPFTSEQIQIANTNKSRDVLVKNLAKNVKDGVITDEDAKQSVYIFDKAQQVSNAVKKLEVNNDEKTQIANLLSKRNNLKTEIENQDDALVVKQKQEINNINQQISDIILNSKPVAETVVAEAPEVTQTRIDRIAEIETTITNDDAKIENPLLEGIRPLLPAEKIKLQTELETLKSEQDAIQIQTAGQVPVQPEATIGEEVVQGEPQAEPQGVAEEGIQEEVTVQAPEIKRESIRLLTDEEVNPLYDEIPMNLLPIAENVSKQDAVFNAYFKSKQNNTNPELVQAVEGLINQTQKQTPAQPKQEVTITTLNPTGTIFTEYTPEDRDRLPLGENITTYDVTAGVNPTEKVTVYRGVPNDINEIKSGDFVTTNKQLATDYAGTGKVISMEVNANEILDDKTEPLGEEYILRIPQAKVSLETQTPKFVRDISALITPATVRAFSPLTKRIQKLSLNYNKLVRQYAEKKDPKVLEKIKNAEAQILNDAKQEIIDAVAKVDGVAVKFNDIKRGLWDNAFEPSFNMILSISPQADTKKLSDLLFDFAEKYSQDSFILETDSELHDEWVNGNINMPLSEKDSNGLTNYPQIIYTFAEPITDEELSALSVALEKEGVAAFNINNNELKVSVFFTEDQDTNLTKDEQYEERNRHYGSKSSAAATAVGQILGRNGLDGRDVVIKKSHYQGAVNEGSPVQTRQYDRSDILKAFKESTTKVEVLAVELAGLRQKEISLQDKGKKLSPKDKARFDELIKIVQPVVQRTFEANKKLYEDAKTEVEGIAQDAITQVDASISPFPIKRAERASVKAIRWYNAFTEKLGDGSRVNIVVDTDANADEVFKIINEKYPRTDERRIKETTTLGYPKRLIEIITSNGTIAEIQVITNEAYLAKDGIKGFTGNEQQKATAKQKLDAVRARLGWSIPDGLGHYFYEIQRDTNVDDNLRNEAARLSDLYYNAFTNPQSKLSESFMRDVMSFKEQVDAADKSEWDTGNEGIAPQSLVDYKTSDVVTEEKQFVPLTADDIEFDKRFSRDEASDVVEGERENENGRVSIYMAEVETPVFDADGEQIGYLVKMVDDDKNLSFEARDENGSNLSKNEEGFETLREAEKALLDNYNKQKKKEFDREAKVEAKKLAKKSAKAEAKKPVEAIDDLLDLDVTNQDNLDRIFNALDNADKSIGKILKSGANEAMLAIPLGTVQVVIKAIKALVKGGMLLRDAIKRVSADNNISQDTIKDIINIAPIQDSFYALMDNIDALIARQKARGIDNKKITSNVDTFIRKQDEYLNANDAQKKIIEREARAKMGAAPKRAVSIGRVLGALKDITNISRAEKLKIISQIRKLSKDAAKDLAKEIRAMASSGRITANQAANIVARFGKVNMLSEISVSKFVDYMAKVFANAEYAAKLNAGKSLKKDISKLSKNKEKNANLRDLAQQFIKIDPSMVDDIDAYNDMASKIKEAIKGSTIRGEKVKFADTVNIENATEYINKTIEAQDEMMRQEKADEIQDLMDVDVSDLSYEDMMMLLDSEEPITKYNEGIIRSTIQKMFNLYSALIETTLNTGKESFTDEDIELTKTQKNLIRRFMDMDLTVLKPKEALQAVDALANFYQNRSTAKMEAVLAAYTGNANAKQLVKEGIVAQQLKKYWSPKIGRFLGEQTTNLNILFERMFKGFNRGGKVEDAMGVTRLKNNKSMAQRESNNIVEKYIAQFYKKTANGEAYNSEYNSTERGLAAFMMRNIIGTEKQMQNEFNRRKGLIEQSIKVLSDGNEKEKGKAELYQKVYDNILKDTNSIQEIKDNTDPTNLEGIDFWNKEWADKYEQLSDVSQNIYNKVLDKDLNYTPDKFVKLSTETGTIELSNDDSAFHNNNGTIYKKETGVLMTAVKPNSLPTNPKNGEISRYIDLSFDKNNSNSMYDALVDIGTAAPIRQIEAFLNSPDFKKIIPTAEDAKVLKERIQLYVGNIRNKNPYSNDELSSMVRGLNRIASIGVGQALGGVLQPVKQMIPVAMNTLINAGNLDIGAIFDSAKNSFINRSGFAISNRGIESQAQVESLNKLIDEASKTKGEKLIKNIEKLNSWWLEKFLVKPDVLIARASWMTYYEQSLNKQGVDTKGIDYNTHEVNQEAAEYAQRMVDRQQNVSDSDLAGKMFSNKEATNQLFVKMLMPFASFRMNQSARFGSDLAVLSDKTATSDDKKIAIKSLSGFAVEMAVFKMVSAGSIILLGSASKWLMGDDEDEEEKEKRINNIIKGQVTSSFTDVVSPLPILDKAFQEGGNFLTETMLDIPKESVFSIYGVPKQDYIQSLGLFGIAADRVGQLYDITKLSTTGKYTDDFGKEKTISEEKQKALGYLIPPAILSNVGLAPVEVNSIVRNAIKYSKKGKEKGKSTEDVSDKEKNTSQKIEALEKIKTNTKNKNVYNAIDEKINELQAGTEEKKNIKEENAEEKQRKEELLTNPVTGEKYDNESELKRYNKRLYNKNFGVRSEWYKEHRYEELVQKKMNLQIRKMEDRENRYRAPVKKTAKKRNSDGSFKRVSSR